LRIITVSDACRQKLKEMRFSNADIRVIHNGIGERREDSLTLNEKHRRLGLGADDSVIGAIGDYEPLKGHEYLIRAFAELAPAHPRAKLILIGSDAFEHAQRLKDLTRELGLQEKVKFTGYLPRAWEFMECFQVLVLPSVAFEGFGLVALEAMLYKVPVVGTRDC
jgi:glycosyltransferase involved in cell wall biosynthesis